MQSATRRSWVALFWAQILWGGFCGLGIVLAAILPYVISVQDDPFKAEYARSSLWLPSIFALILGVLSGTSAFLASRLSTDFVRTREASHPRVYFALPAAAFFVALAVDVLAIGPLLSIFPLSYSLISLIAGLGAGALTLLLIRPANHGSASAQVDAS